jgi:hypothetical protein
VASAIPTKSGRSLSLRIRIVPRKVSRAHSAPFESMSALSDTIAYVGVAKSWVGDMRKPSSSRCVRSTAVSAHPPARRPNAMTPAITPTTINKILPTVPPPLRSSASMAGSAACSATSGAGGCASDLVGSLVSVPPWSSRNGGYSSRIRST